MCEAAGIKGGISMLSVMDLVQRVLVRDTHKATITYMHLF